MNHLRLLILIIVTISISGCSTFAMTRGVYRSAVPHYEYKADSVYEAYGAYFIVIARSVNGSMNVYNITIKSKSDESITYDPVSKEINVMGIDYAFHLVKESEKNYINYDAFREKRGAHAIIPVKKWVIIENGIKRPFETQKFDQSNSFLYFSFPLYPITVVLDVIFGPLEVISEVGNAYGAGNH